MTKQNWTPEADKMLASLWMQGFSCSQIARMMADEGHPGRSHNAIIGRKFRIGLPDRAVPSLPKVRRKRCVERRPRIWPKKAWERNPNPSPPPAPKPLQDELWPLARLEDLTNTTCRWPVGDPRNEHSFGYCGRATEVEHSYCAHHRCVAFAPDVPRPRRAPPQRTRMQMLQGMAP